MADATAETIRSIRTALAMVLVMFAPYPRILNLHHRIIKRSLQFDIVDERTYCALETSTCGGFNMRSVAVFVVLLTLTIAPGAKAAHHSFAAEFDSAKQVTLTGKV